MIVSALPRARVRRNPTVVPYEFCQWPVFALAVVRKGSNEFELMMALLDDFTLWFRSASGLAKL